MILAMVSGVIQNITKKERSYNYFNYFTYIYFQIFTSNFIINLTARWHYFCCIKTNKQNTKIYTNYEKAISINNYVFFNAIHCI